MVGQQHVGARRLSALQLEGGKYQIFFPAVRRLPSPVEQMSRENGMQRNGTLRRPRLGLAEFPINIGPTDVDTLAARVDVLPLQCQDLRNAFFIMTTLRLSILPHSTMRQVRARNQ